MLRFEKHATRATITIDDPERRNPLTGETLEALCVSLSDASGDSAVRTIVITGSGDQAFSAGGDLSGGFFDDPIGLHRTRGLIADTFRLLRAAGKPTIARVNGHALAGGFGLAAACDIVLALDGAKMGATEIKVGLWPMQISSVLQRLMSPRQALELFLTGRIFTAAEGVDLGIVTRAVGTMDELDAEVDRYVDLFARLPADVVAFGRDAFYTTQDMGLDRALDHLQTGLTAVSMTDSAAEGVRAFMEKRDPSWSAPPAPSTDEG